MGLGLEVWSLDIGNTFSARLLFSSFNDLNSCLFSILVRAEIISCYVFAVESLSKSIEERSGGFYDRRSRRMFDLDCVLCCDSKISFLIPDFFNCTY